MSDNKALTRPAIALAVSIPLLLGGLYAGNTARSITGPLAIAVGDGQVAIAAPGLLYRLDHDGSLLGVEDDVIAPDARDAGLLWLQDALLASPGTDGGGLLRCSTDGCSPFSADPYAPTGPVQAHADGGIIWLAETDADRLHRFRLDGKRIDMPLSDLSQPGSVLREDDAVLVCNTGSARLDSHRIHKTGLDAAEQRAKFPSDDTKDPVSRPLRLLADNSGGYRVLLTNAARSRGMLARISSDLEVNPVDLPMLSNPVSMAWLGNDLLVVDEDLMQVVRIGVDGEATLFGDEEFNVRLAAERTTREALRLLSPVLMMACAFTAAIGGSWLLLAVFRRRGDPARDVGPGADGIAWLPTETELGGERTTRNLMVALPTAIFPAAAIAWLWGPLAAAGWSVVVLAAAVIPAQLAASRARDPRGTRIGFRGRILVVADTERGMREYPLAQVRWNEHQLQPTSKDIVNFSQNGVPVFHPPTLSACLLPKLDPAQQLPLS